MVTSCGLIHWATTRLGRDEHATVCHVGAWSTDLRPCGGWHLVHSIISLVAGRVLRRTARVAKELLVLVLPIVLLRRLT